MLRSQWQSFLTSVSHPPTAASGVCYVPELALLRFSGADTMTFLQGYLTSEVFSLSDAHLAPTALCNLKGRVIANGWASKNGDDVDLIVHESMIEPLIAFLKKYLVFSKTTLQNGCGSHLIFAGIDSGSGLSIGGSKTLQVVENLEIARELYANTARLGISHWASSLIQDDLALVSLPVSERFLPQMLALERSGAVDFDKGCYLGQEVVARAQHRGRVKRELAKLTWNGKPPAAGMDFQTSDNTGVVIQAQETEPASGVCLAVVAVLSSNRVSNSENSTSFQLVQ